MWQSQILRDARYVNGKQEIWNIKFIWCLISIGNPGFISFDFLTGQSGKLSGIITDKNALHTDCFPDDITGFLIPFRFRLFQQKFISLFQRKSWVHKIWLIRSGNRKKIGHNGRRNVRVMQCSKVYIKKLKIKKKNLLTTFINYTNFFTDRLSLSVKAMCLKIMLNCLTLV